MTSYQIVADYIYLVFHGRVEELDAIYELQIEEYEDEPFSWGGSRGMASEVISARLISWHRHGIEYDRADAVAQDGDAEIIRQESALADTAEIPAAIAAE